MRIKRDRLDPSDSYESAWIGDTRWGGRTQLTGHGRQAGPDDEQGVGVRGQVGPGNRQGVQHHTGHLSPSQPCPRDMTGLMNDLHAEPGS
jgi:hypothetical protein